MGEHDIRHQRDLGLDEYVEVKRRLFFNAGLKGTLRVDVPADDGSRPVHIPGRVLGQRVEGADLGRSFSEYGPVGHLFVEFFVIVVGLAEVVGLFRGQVGVYYLVK